MCILFPRVCAVFLVFLPADSRPGRVLLFAARYLGRIRQQHNPRGLFTSGQPEACEFLYAPDQRRERRRRLLNRPGSKQVTSIVMVSSATQGSALRITRKRDRGKRIKRRHHLSPSSPPESSSPPKGTSFLVSYDAFPP